MGDATNSALPTSDVVRYDSFGDSITFGDEINFDVDPSGYPRDTSTTLQGWPGILSSLLTEKTGEKTEVLNWGYRGDSAVQSRIELRPDSLVGNHRSDHALLLLGTNDSNTFNPTPSGRGCVGAECADTYKGHMISLIRVLQSAGRDPVYVGILPPVWGPTRSVVYPDALDPLVATRNVRIQEYNQVIKNELSNLHSVKLGPDFFSCFLTPTVNRFSLFKDALHPNALGYIFMAALWRDVITGSPVNPPVDPCPSPVYILESLDPYSHGHKQNLLEVGDEYYTDAAYTLTGIPVELANGIWVSQANADNENTDASFLSFDAGSAPVTVYIVYDPAGDPPTSSTHAFTPVTLSADLAVSDLSVGNFAIVQSTGVTGTVSIGGTKSGAAPAPQQAYVVIVVPWTNSRTVSRRP